MAYGFMAETTAGLSDVSTIRACRYTRTIDITSSTSGSLIITGEETPSNSFVVVKPNDGKMPPRIVWRSTNGDNYVQWLTQGIPDPSSNFSLRFLRFA